MHALSEAFSHWSRGDVGSVLHIGAGAGAVLAAYDSLQPLRLQLVEGEPLQAASLREAAASRPGVLVEGQAVSAHGGPVDWYRCSLPALNGPVNLGGLKTYYPRLRILDKATVSTTALLQLVRRSAATPGPQGQRILVLDLPGQEDALLASLGAELQDTFDAVVLCGCAVDTGPGSSTAAAAVQRLEASGARLAWTDAQRAALWPVHVLRLQPTRRPAPPEGRGPRAEDALQQSLAELRARCAEQAAENTALRQRLAEVTHELEALSSAGHGPARTGEDMTLLSQQLRDAEGQIELLKDLLLRDPAA